MKRLFLLFYSLVLTIGLSAQAPEKMSYQAVVRNAVNELVTNQSVGMQISILKDSPTGSVVYSETHNPTSNGNGLVSIEIGAGTIITGDFAGIDWSTGIFFVKNEIDPNGGTNYTISGTSQLLSVPYALHAKTADQVLSYPASIYHNSSVLNFARRDVDSVYVPMEPVFTINKVHDNSKIEVTFNSYIYSGTFEPGTYGLLFEIRIDGEKYDFGNQGALRQSQTSEFISMFAVFEGLPAGSHDIQVYTVAVNGSSTDVLLDSGGWGGRMVAKETF